MMEYRHRAEIAVRALPPLTLPANRLAPSAGRGAHGQRKSGPGDSFWQFRPFVAGDSESAIDWRRSARSDSHYIRQNEWETTQNVWLWCDSSASMRYRSDGMAETKLDRAITLALGAAILLAEGGERVGYLGSHAKPACGNPAVQRCMEAIDLARFSESPAIPEPGELRRFSHVILFGDFLDEEEGIRRRMAALAACGVVGHLVQISDPAEEDFPFTGRVNFAGLEQEAGELVPRAESIRGQYRRRMEAWRETLLTLSRSLGWSYTHARTDRPPHLALLGLMNALGSQA
jgi:uncharacterized protein (DUF58 family)